MLLWKGHYAVGASTCKAIELRQFLHTLVDVACMASDNLDVLQASVCHEVSIKFALCRRLHALPIQGAKPLGHRRWYYHW
jgi:hypothetical protein